MQEQNRLTKRVLVDADACPKRALAVAEAACEEYGWTLVTYASTDHLRTGERHVMVDAGPQAVDIRLANDAAPGDIVLTEDIGLAALVLGRRARALTPRGNVFDPATIAFQLEERHGKAKTRRGGGRTKGPAARTPEDDLRLAQALRRMMEEDGR